MRILPARQSLNSIWQRNLHAHVRRRAACFFPPRRNRKSWNSHWRGLPAWSATTGLERWSCWIRIILKDFACGVLHPRLKKVRRETCLSPRKNSPPSPHCAGSVPHSGPLSLWRAVSQYAWFARRKKKCREKCCGRQGRGARPATGGRKKPGRVMSGTSRYRIRAESLFTGSYTICWEEGGSWKEVMTETSSRFPVKTFQSALLIFRFCLSLCLCVSVVKGL